MNIFNLKTVSIVICAKSPIFHFDFTTPAARVSLVFSNDHSVLSQCNTQLRLLYLLSKVQSSINPFYFVVL